MLNLQTKSSLHPQRFDTKNAGCLKSQSSLHHFFYRFGLTHVAFGIHQSAAGQSQIRFRAIQYRIQEQTVMFR